MDLGFGESGLGLRASDVWLRAEGLGLGTGGWGRSGLHGVGMKTSITVENSWVVNKPNAVTIRKKT